MGLPVQDFNDFLWMRGGRWAWTGHHFTSEAAPKVGSALSEYAGGFWQGMPTPRPLGMAVVRLLWELGALAFKSGALADSFVRNGMVGLRVSMATPWAVGEIPWDILDQLLGNAMVHGDSQLRSVEGSSREGGLHTVSNTRMFALGWREESPAAALGYGYAPAETPDLEIAAFDGHQEPVVHALGQPWFSGSPWPDSAVRVRFPGNMDGVLPATFEWMGRVGPERLYIPGSEPGPRIELEGHAFTGAGRLPARARTYRDEAPGLHLHLSYIPGWQSAGMAGVRLLEWSGLSEEQKQFHREWSEFIDDGWGEEPFGFDDES